MSVLTAEQAGLVEELLPSVDSLARQRAAECVGSSVVADTIKIERAEEDSSPQTLLDALKLADTDADADAIADSNIGAEVGERLFNYGHHMRHKLTVNKTNEFSQSGVSLPQVSVNTLENVILNDVMRYRTVTELGNSYVFDTLRKLGVFETHIAVVASHTPDDHVTKKEYNFFENTDSVSLQAIYEQEGDYVFDAAFVAGKTKPDAPRHDLEAVRQAAAEFGVTVGSANTETMLTRIMLIPREKLPGRLATFVEAYDDAISPEGNTFYGTKEPRQNYGEYQEECLARDFGAITNSVKAKLLDEVTSMIHPIEAIERLDYWSRRFSIRQAVMDGDIDEMVFGDASALYIQQARVAAEDWNYPEVERLLQQAVNNDQSSSCPFKAGENDSDQDFGLPGEQGVGEDEVMEDCEFISKHCPKCGEENVKTICKKGKFYGECGCVSD